MLWLMTLLRLLGNASKAQADQAMLPWAIIGVYPDDPDALIETVYRAKARFYHPDLGGNEERMKALNWAYHEIKRTRGRP